MARLSPAEHVIRTIGGVRKTARAIGREPSSISAWRSAKGTNGQVPRNAQRSILTYARAKKLDITASDLILGRDVPSTKKKRAS
jgi:hypothetical protein